MCRTTRVSSLLLAVSMLASAFAIAVEPMPEYLGELNARILQVHGRTLKLSLRGPYLPQVGDRGEVLRASAQGTVRGVGWAIVSQVEGTRIYALLQDAEPGATTDDSMLIRISAPPEATLKIGHKFRRTDDPAGGLFATEGEGRSLLELLVQADDGRRTEIARANMEDVQAGEALLRQKDDASVRLGLARLLRAAERNHAAAALQLATAYRDQIVPPDAAAAARWLRRAAELGSVDAQYAMARAYEGEGRLFALDQSSAVAWYELALANGASQAAQDLARLGATTSGAPR